MLGRAGGGMAGSGAIIHLQGDILAA